MPASTLYASQKDKTHAGAQFRHFGQTSTTKRTFVFPARSLTSVLVLQQRVFGNLDGYSIRNVMLTCRLWRDTADSVEVWMRVTDSFWDNLDGSHVSVAPLKSTPPPDSLRSSNEAASEVASSGTKLTTSGSRLTGPLRRSHGKRKQIKDSTEILHQVIYKHVFHDTQVTPAAPAEEPAVRQLRVKDSFSSVSTATTATTSTLSSSASALNSSMRDTRSMASTDEDMSEIDQMLSLSRLGQATHAQSWHGSRTDLAAAISAVDSTNQNKHDNRMAHQNEASASPARSGGLEKVLEADAEPSDASSESPTQDSSSDAISNVSHSVHSQNSSSYSLVDHVQQQQRAEYGVTEQISSNSRLRPNVPQARASPPPHLLLGIRHTVSSPVSRHSGVNNIQQESPLPIFRELSAQDAPQEDVLRRWLPSEEEITYLLKESHQATANDFKEYYRLISTCLIVDPTLEFPETSSPQANADPMTIVTRMGTETLAERLLRVNQELWTFGSPHRPLRRWRIFATLPDAIRHAQAGDFIYLHKGVYSEPLTITKPIRLCGQMRINESSVFLQAQIHTTIHWKALQTVKFFPQSYDFLAPLSPSTHANLRASSSSISSSSSSSSSSAPNSPRSTPAYLLSDPTLRGSISCIDMSSQLARGEPALVVYPRAALDVHHSLFRNHEGTAVRVASHATILLLRTSFAGNMHALDVSPIANSLGLYKNSYKDHLTPDLVPLVVDIAKRHAKSVLASDGKGPCVANQLFAESVLSILDLLLVKEVKEIALAVLVPDVLPLVLTVASHAPRFLPLTQNLAAALNVFMKIEPSRSFLAANDGLQTIRAMMIRHADDGFVQAESLSALWRLAGQESLRPAVDSLRIEEVIMAAIYKFGSKSSSIVAAALGALWNLSWLSEKLAARVLLKLADLCSLQRQYLENEHIQCNWCGLLWNMSTTQGSEAANLFARHGTVPAIYAALKAHPKSARLYKTAASLLRYIVSFRPEQARIFVELGGIAVLLAALDTFSAASSQDLFFSLDSTLAVLWEATPCVPEFDAHCGLFMTLTAYYNFFASSRSVLASAAFSLTSNRPTVIPVNGAAHRSSTPQTSKQPKPLSDLRLLNFCSQRKQDIHAILASFYTATGIKANQLHKLIQTSPENPLPPLALPTTPIVEHFHHLLQNSEASQSHLFMTTVLKLLLSKDPSRLFCIRAGALDILTTLTTSLYKSAQSLSLTGRYNLGAGSPVPPMLAANGRDFSSLAISSPIVVPPSAPQVQPANVNPSKLNHFFGEFVDVVKTPEPASTSSSSISPSAGSSSSSSLLVSSSSGSNVPDTQKLNKFFGERVDLVLQTELSSRARSSPEPTEERLVASMAAMALAPSKQGHHHHKEHHHHVKEREVTKVAHPESVVVDLAEEEALTSSVTSLWALPSTPVAPMPRGGLKTNLRGRPHPDSAWSARSPPPGPPSQSGSEPPSPSSSPSPTSVPPFPPSSSSSSSNAADSLFGTALSSLTGFSASGMGIRASMAPAATKGSSSKGPSASSGKKVGKEGKEGKEGKDGKEGKEHKAHKEHKERKEPKASKESKDSVESATKGSSSALFSSFGSQSSSSSSVSAKSSTSSHPSLGNGSKPNLLMQSQPSGSTTSSSGPNSLASGTRPNLLMHSQPSLVSSSSPNLATASMNSSAPISSSIAHSVSPKHSSPHHHAVIVPPTSAYGAGNTDPSTFQLIRTPTLTIAEQNSIELAKMIFDCYSMLSMLFDTDSRSGRLNVSSCVEFLSALELLVSTLTSIPHIPGYLIQWTRDKRASMLSISDLKARQESLVPSDSPELSELSSASSNASSSNLNVSSASARRFRALKLSSSWQISSQPTPLMAEPNTPVFLDPKFKTRFLLLQSDYATVWNPHATLESIRGNHFCPTGSKSYFELEFVRFDTCAGGLLPSAQRTSHPHQYEETSLAPLVAIGWCTARSVFFSSRVGVANEPHSWSAHPVRRVATPKSSQTNQVIHTWCVGDRIQCAIDTNKTEIFYGINGTWSQAPAFRQFNQSFDAALDLGYAPAITLYQGCEAKVHFGSSCRFSPPS